MAMGRRSWGWRTLGGAVAGGPCAAAGALVMAVLVVAPAALAADSAPSGTRPAVVDGPKSTSTADHSKFEALNGPFASGPAVTEACLSCHTEASDQVMHAIHYTWRFDHPGTGQTLGKREVINAFCGNVVANEARCTSCHAGYGWEDMDQPPPQQASAVDCLVCHDRSGQYAKTATAAGHPPLGEVPDKAKTVTGAKAWPVDLVKAAQSVGNPTRDNCGQCHFYGGGGDNVKHGDLSSALYTPSRAVDVHMAVDGENFACSTCHVSDSHQWPGSRYAVHTSDPDGTGKPGARRDVATCQSCHGSAPHPSTVVGLKLNDHAETLACQTCHIPSFARGGVATKTVWDWSTAGRLKDGKPFSEEGYTQGNGAHLHTYMSTKGDFAWGEDVVPHYRWFDGQVRYTTSDEIIDPSRHVEINRVVGDRADGRSRIWPFKRMEGRQAYDAGHNRLAYSHVWGPGTETAFWSNFDWGKAISAGMAAAGKDYSGTYGFIDTYMYWPITHMVAPASAALDCGACHAADGRLAAIGDVYMPGTDPFRTAGLFGLAMVVAVVVAIIGHAGLRLLSRKKGGARHG